ncbi:hypothetical protein [Nostoc sp.]|uniref:hypothetical protein n=1 Tax=Nostoc sp. TaxID=1180 RepID=UPI002FF72FF8
MAEATRLPLTYSFSSVQLYGWVQRSLLTFQDALLANHLLVRFLEPMPYQTYMPLLFVLTSSNLDNVRQSQVIQLPLFQNENANF